LHACRAALLASSILTLASALPAWSQDATWNTNAATTNFNTGSNWDTGSVPTGTAVFGTSATTTLTFSGFITNIDGWTFNTGASAYTFLNNVSSHGLNFTGAGIVVNGGSVTITNGGTLSFNSSSTAGSAAITNNRTLYFYDNSTAGSAAITNNYRWSFYNSSTAGSAIITNNSLMDFNQNSTAGSATINNVGTIYFYQNSTAGTATIDNSGDLRFSNSSTAGSATITNNNGHEIHFSNNSTAGNARLIINSGSLVDFSFTTGLNNDSKIEAGSIEGGGLFYTGNNQLTVGSNNLSTTVTGVISDGGIAGGTGASLVKTGTGTLTLSGANTYSGGTTISAGTLALSGGGDIASSSGVNVSASGAIFSISGTTAGATIKSLSGVTGAQVALGARTLTLSDASGSFAGAIGGTGGGLTLTSGAQTLSGINTYTGATTVDGGILSVNGSLSSLSTVTVNSGGTLGGIGTVGNTTISTGATLAPGNSIGTLTVNGNLTFSTGTTYSVEVSPTASDRTDVIGVATLTGATVQATALPGSFSGRTYTLVNATGGFGGTQFAGLTTTGSFAPARNPHLTYDANNVYLVLDPSTLQLPGGASSNQQSVAGAINRYVENGGAPPAGFDVLLNMTSAQQGDALNQLSGQPSGGATTAGAQMTTSFMTLMLNPFSGDSNAGSGALGYARGFGASENAKASEAYAAVTPKDRRALAASFNQRWSLWGSAYGGTNQRGGNASTGSADTSTRTYGFAAGADYRPAADWLVGFALAGGNTSWSLSQGLGGGKADVFQIGGYASKTFGAAYISGALTYAWHDVTTDRTVTVSGTDKLTASFNAHSIGARLEAGTKVRTPWLGVTPYAALQAQSFKTPSYGESVVSGSNTFALAYTSRTSNTLRTELGTWLDKSFLLGNADILTLRSRAAWAHDYANDNGINAAFQTLPGSSFTVNGAAAPKNSALLSLGGEWRMANGVTLGARFDGEFAQNSQSYAGTGSLRYAW